MIGTRFYFVFIGLALFNNVANAQNMTLEDLNLGGIDLDSIPNLPENFMNVSDLATLEVTEAPAAPTEPEAPAEPEAPVTEEPASPPCSTNPPEPVTEPPAITIPANKINGVEYTLTDGHINNYFVFSAGNKKEPSTPAPAPAGDVNVNLQEILYQVNKIINSGADNAAANKLQQQQLDEIKKIQDELRVLLEGAHNATTNVQNVIQNGIPNNLFRRLFRAIPAFHDAARRALQQAVANLAKRREAIREASKAIFNAGKTIIEGKIEAVNSATGVLQETADAFTKDTNC